jgi:hypothetical protein
MPIELTSEQAAAIGNVLETADNYCCVCAANLAAEMAAICPGHDWLVLVGGEHDDDGPLVDLASGGRVVYGAPDGA